LSIVQAASANLHSATALVGVAMANRLPVISPTADLGSIPANLAYLFSPPTHFYALADNVAQTAFDGFTLYHRQETAEAALEQANAQYRGTVITAFQNVANSLCALQADAGALKAATAAEKRQRIGRTAGGHRRAHQRGGIGSALHAGRIAYSLCRMDKAGNPVCRLCEVPIDRVLAEGCKLSHTLPDLAGAVQRYETCQANLAAQKTKLGGSQRERSALPADIALAKQAHERSNRNLKAIERGQDAGNDEVFRARRLIDDIGRYDGLIRLRAQAKERSDGNASNVVRSRAALETLRAEQGDVFRRLTQHFDAIIRNFVGPTSSGRVALSAQGLDLSVQMSGEWSTAAIESLKVLAFDLAALCLSMEGDTDSRVPRSRQPARGGPRISSAVPPHRGP
jgi:hypothetical protein